MLQAAELGALAAHGPGLVRTQPQHVGATGDRVDLAAQARYPEAVADITAVDVAFHHLAQRRHQLVDRSGDRRAVRIHVVALTLPLARDALHELPPHRAI